MGSILSSSNGLVVPAVDGQRACHPRAIEEQRIEEHWTEELGAPAHRVWRIDDCMWIEGASLAVAAARHAVDDGLELRDADGFDDVIDEAGLAALAHVVFHAVAA